MYIIYITYRIGLPKTVLIIENTWIIHGNMIHSNHMQILSLQESNSSYFIGGGMGGGLDYASAFIDFLIKHWYEILNEVAYKHKTRTTWQYKSDRGVLFTEEY